MTRYSKLAVVAPIPRNSVQIDMAAADDVGAAAAVADAMDSTPAVAVKDSTAVDGSIAAFDEGCWRPLP